MKIKSLEQYKFFKKKYSDILVKASVKDINQYTKKIREILTRVLKILMIIVSYPN